MNTLDSGSAVLLSVAVLFGGAAGTFLQTNFVYALGCAAVAVACVVAREFVKQ